MPTKESKKDLKDARAEIRKKHGDGAVMVLGEEEPVHVEVISTGLLSLDYAIRHPNPETGTPIGGIPRGRVTELFGPECVSGKTFIQYQVRVDGGRSANCKGGTIRRLFERFHHLRVGGGGNYQRAVTENAKFFAPSVNDEGRIVRNEILSVVSSGQKDCFEVHTNLGQKIIATNEHLFVTDFGSIPSVEYTRLADLSVGDAVFVHNNTPFTVEKKKDSSGGRVDLYVRHHPVAGVKKVFSIINHTTGEKKEYQYHRLNRARAVAEASLNHLSFEQYMERLDSGQLEGLVFLSREQHVHHKDENETNDAPDNLEVLSGQEHNRRHALEMHNNLRFVAVPAKITSIFYIGEQDTYDLVMADPYRNFVANGFVVHNSGGKSTLMQQVFANAKTTSQRYSALVDSEHTFDPEYARKIGVDVDNLVISQPQSGEEALDILETLIKSNSVDLAAVDSAAMLTPKAEIEGEIGDSHVGGRARLLTQALSKLVPIIAGHNVAVIFTNQMRDKIGFSGYGDPTSTPGGRSLKHNASLRIEVRRIGMLKIGERIVGARVRFRIAKNKLDAPFREAQADLIFGRGFCPAGDLIDFAVEHGVMQKSGATYQFGEEEFKRGRESLRERLLGDADLFGRIRQAVMVKINGAPVAAGSEK